MEETASGPDDLEEAARRRGWPEGLLQRAVGLRVPRAVIQRWLTQPWGGPEYVQRRIDWHDRLTFGTLRGREATRADNEAFADLWANAPEEIGDWEITNERGPNAFAQFRLQENVVLLVIEEAGQLIASCSFAAHKVVCGAKRLTVHYGQALRVRKEYRGQGYGDQVRSLPWSVGAGRPTHGQYDITRSENFAIVDWWKKYAPAFFDNVPERAGAVPGIPVTVLQYPPRPFEGDPSGIRKARPADLGRCVGLINRTQRGLDIIRPYSREFLQDRLDDGFWGDPHPDWSWPAVYGWPDYYVLEEQGRVVACAGLWDRGRDMRDRFRNKVTGEEKVISVTAVLDFGYEAGQEASIARLIAFLIGETHRLRRDYLTIPLDQLPALAERLDEYEPVPETRSLRWGVEQVSIARPHVDLSYW